MTRLFFIENAFIIVLFDLVFLILTDVIMRPLSLMYYASSKEQLAMNSKIYIIKIAVVYLMTFLFWVVLPEVDAKHSTPILTKIMDIFYDGSGAIALYFIIENIVRVFRYRKKKGT